MINMNEHDAWFSSNVCIVPPQRKKTWLEKRTSMEKQFLIILAICFFILVFLITFMFSMYLKYGFALRFIRPLANVLEEVNKLDKDALISKLKGGNVCLTPKCVTIGNIYMIQCIIDTKCVHIMKASELIDGMDTSVNACDDFYEMTCGNWINKHSIPGNRGEVSNFDQLNFDATKEIKNILEDLHRLANNNRIYRNLYDFWNVCNNETRLESEKDNELKLFIEQKLGGWPMAKNNLDDNDTEKLDLVDFHTKLSEQGYSIDGLIHISTAIDVFNSSRNTILVTPHAVSLHHSYLIRNTTDLKIRNYFNLIKDAVQTYNPDIKADDNEIWKMIEFEKQLSLMTRPNEHNHKNLSNLHKGKLSDLFIIEPQFPWNEFLKLIYQHDLPATHNLLYTDKAYLENFYQFISTTNPRY